MTDGFNARIEKGDFRRVVGGEAVTFRVISPEDFEPKRALETRCCNSRFTWTDVGVLRDGLPAKFPLCDACGGWASLRVLLDTEEGA